MQFIVHMKEIFSTIIALVCHVPFLIPTVFHSLPYLELPKVCTFYICKTEVQRASDSTCCSLSFHENIVVVMYMYSDSQRFESTIVHK